MNDKSNYAYKTIGEVVKILNSNTKSNNKIATHTIRFWETQFKQIKPIILNGKRRYYDHKNIELLKKIKFLLKDQGMTINGARKLLDKKESNNLDEFLNKPIRTVNLRNKISNIYKIIKELKDIK